LKSTCAATPAGSVARISRWRRRLRHFVSIGLLCLVAASSIGAAAAQEWRYRVRPGDNVWDLAGKYVRSDIAWQRLQAHNDIDDPYRLAPGSVMRFPVAWLKQQPAKARVISVQGNATLRVPGLGHASAVTADMQVGIGSVLRTDSDASLTLEFADGSRLLLQGGSELALDKLSSYGATGMVDTRMRLPKGRTSSEVQPMHGPASHFIIQTPDTTSSVRGTRFRIGSDGVRSQAEVTEGSVAVSRGARQLVLAPGQGTATGPDGQLLEPQVLLPPPSSLALDPAQRPMRLQWEPVPGARQYRVQVGTTPAFLALLHDRIVTDNKDTLDALPDGTYGIRVRAIDGHGIEGRDAVIEPQVVLSPPFTLSPTDGSGTDAQRPRLRWASMGSGIRYHVQLAGPDGFGNPLLDIPGIRDHDMRSPQALSPGEYQWRVAAIDDDNRVSPFSDAVRFRVLAAGSGPEIERGEAEARTLHVRWPAARDGQHYRFQLSRKSDFSTLEVDRELQDQQLALPDLRAGTWYARVQAVDSDGYAHPFGPAQELKLGCLPCRIVAGGGFVLLLLAL
jgi:hypothetical protein